MNSLDKLLIRFSTVIPAEFVTVLGNNLLST